MFPAFFVWDVNLFPIHFLTSLAITLFLDVGGALSLLKTAELNGQWQQLWFPAPAA